MSQIQQDLKLKIDDFGADKEILRNIRNYHKLLADYMGKMRFRSILHSNNSFKSF